jgi:hypothetical protein
VWVREYCSQEDSEGELINKEIDTNLARRVGSVWWKNSEQQSKRTV